MSIDQILGLVTGVVFGFLMQKGRVIRFEKQVGALLIKDMTIFKFMLSSILVGMVGIFILSDMGIITFSHKPMNVGAVVIGAILFGIGWAVMGFCPALPSQLWAKAVCTLCLALRECSSVRRYLPRFILSFNQPSWRGRISAKSVCRVLWAFPTGYSCRFSGRQRSDCLWCLRKMVCKI